MWDDFDITSMVSATKIPRVEMPEEKFIDVSVQNAADDVSFGLEGEPTLNFTKGGKVSITFRGIPLSKSQSKNIEHAHLQLMAVTDSIGSSFSISGAIGSSTVLSSAKVACIQDESEEWNHHEVWVSPDLKDIIVEAAEWNEDGASITFVIGDIEGDLTAYSFEHSPCVAPSLAIQLKH